MKLINFTDMSMEIRGYGYTYSIKQFIAQLLLSYVLLIIAGTFFQLHPTCIIILCIWAFLWLPMIVLAQFRYLANNKKFEMVVGYLEQMIFAFKKSPKILESFKNVVDIVDPRIAKDVQKAIVCIEQDKDGTGYMLAFKTMEDKYMCTRIKTLHKFMMNVEENGGKYQQSIDILLEDIQTWITCTYEYQKELKGIKGKILLSIILSIMIAGTMMAIIPKELVVFGDSIIYLISTTLLFCMLIWLIAFVQIKLNGKWFVDDTEATSEKTIRKALSNIGEHDKSNSRKKSLIAFIITLPISVIGWLIQSDFILIVGVLFSFIVYSSRKWRYKNARRRIQRALEKEFPIWLRDISLQLQTLVIPLAIKNSIATAPLVLQTPLRRLTTAIENNPTSIKPYSDFLKDYHLTDVTNAMKIIYTIQTLHMEDAYQQIDDLVKRNQKMLARAEKIRNEDMLMSIGFIVAAPMVLSTFKLIVDLVLVMASFMTMSKGML